MKYSIIEGDLFQEIILKEAIFMHKINEETENTQQPQENFATEIFREFKAQQKGRMIISITAITGLTIVLVVGIYAHFKSLRRIGGGWNG